MCLQNVKQNSKKMKRILVLTIAIFALLQVNAQTSFYDYTVKTLEGEDFPLSQLKGKKVLVVNTASKCGFTPQYEQLEAIYKQYGDDNFVVIGFPANNFMKQEPGTAEEIREFCTQNYGVTFPMMAKISVKGEDMAPIYHWLTEKAKNGVEDSKVRWNFQKYLINEKGELEKIFYPKVKPDSDEIISWITSK